MEHLILFRKSQLVTIHAQWLVFSGYNFQCDARQLSQSYEELRCFKNYEMLLDIQSIFKGLRGGLAGLTEVVCVNVSLSVSCLLLSSSDI